MLEVVAPVSEVISAVFGGNERGALPSVRLLLSGTEPVRRTVSAPRVRSVKPSVREK